MRVAAIQLTAGLDVAPNLDRADGLIRAAASDGAVFVSTPETTHMMDLDRSRILAKAREEHEDPGVRRFSDLAGELGIWLHVGSLVILRPDGRLANRGFLFAPNGDLVARYDKIHMFDVTLKDGERYEESALYTPGSEAVVTVCGDLTFGLSVCYDLRFAGLYRALASAGAEVLLVPSAFTLRTGEAHWHTLLRARAIETGSYVVAAAQTGRHETGRSTYGHALIVGPWGDVIADAGTSGDWISADLDPRAVAEVRQRIPVLESAREFTIKTVAK